MNIPDISFPQMPWRKDRYIDVNIPEGLKEGDALTIKQGDNTFDVKMPPGENIQTITVDPPDGDSKDETKDEKMAPLDLKNALEIDPYGIKLVDKLQKYGFFKQEDFQEIARKMSEEGIRNVLMAYSKLLLKIPQALLQKVQKQMLPQMDENKPVTDTEFQKYFQELTEQYTGLFGAMNMIMEEEGVKVARDKLLEAIKEEFIKPALQIGADALDESSEQLDGKIEKIGDKIEKMIRSSLNAGFHGAAGAGPVGNAFSIGRAGLAAAAAAASGIGLASNSMEALFETIDKTTDKNKQNIKKYAKFLRDRSKQVKDVSDFIENFLQQPFGDVPDKDYNKTKKTSAPKVESKKDNKTIDKPTVPAVPTVPTVPAVPAVPVNPGDPAATAAALPVEAAKAVSDTPVVAEAVPVNPTDNDTSTPVAAQAIPVDAKPVAAVKPSAPPVDAKPVAAAPKKGGHRKTKKKHHKKSTHNKTKSKK
tara:strand:+ start:16751 stop:18181 length:1431 start_codon:yes stop_codon:yes gene_type:complete